MRIKGKFLYQKIIYRLEVILKKFKCNLDLQFMKNLVYDSFYENMLVCLTLRPQFKIVGDDLVFNQNTRFYSLINHLTLLQLDDFENNLALGRSYKNQKDETYKDLPEYLNEGIKFSQPYTSESSRKYLSELQNKRKSCEPNILDKWLENTTNPQKLDELPEHDSSLISKTDNKDISLKNKEPNSIKPKLSKSSIMMNKVLMQSRRKILINNSFIIGKIYILINQKMGVCLILNLSIVKSN